MRPTGVEMKLTFRVIRCFYVLVESGTDKIFIHNISDSSCTLSSTTLSFMQHFDSRPSALAAAAQLKATLLRQIDHTDSIAADLAALQSPMRDDGKNHISPSPFRILSPPSPVPRPVIPSQLNETDPALDATDVDAREERAGSVTVAAVASEADNEHTFHLLDRVNGLNGSRDCTADSPSFSLVAPGDDNRNEGHRGDAVADALLQLHAKIHRLELDRNHHRDECRRLLAAHEEYKSKVRKEIEEERVAFSQQEADLCSQLKSEREAKHALNLALIESNNILESFKDEIIAKITQERERHQAETRQKSSLIAEYEEKIAELQRHMYSDDPKKGSGQSLTGRVTKLDDAIRTADKQQHIMAEIAAQLSAIATGSVPDEERIGATTRVLEATVNSITQASSTDGDAFVSPALVAMLPLLKSVHSRLVEIEGREKRAAEQIVSLTAEVERMRGDVRPGLSPSGRVPTSGSKQLSQQQHTQDQSASSPRPVACLSPRLINQPQRVVTNRSAETGRSTSKNRGRSTHHRDDPQPLQQPPMRFRQSPPGRSSSAGHRGSGQQGDRHHRNTNTTHSGNRPLSPQLLVDSYLAAVNNSNSTSDSNHFSRQHHSIDERRHYRSPTVCSITRSRASAVNDSDLTLSGGCNRHQHHQEQHQHNISGLSQQKVISTHSMPRKSVVGMISNSANGHNHISTTKSSIRGSSDLGHTPKPLHTYTAVNSKKSGMNINPSVAAHSKYDRSIASSAPHLSTKAVNSASSVTVVNGQTHLNNSKQLTYPAAAVKVPDPSSNSDVNNSSHLQHYTHKGEDTASLATLCGDLTQQLAELRAVYDAVQGQEAPADTATGSAGKPATPANLTSKNRNSSVQQAQELNYLMAVIDRKSEQLRLLKLHMSAMQPRST